MPVSVLTLSSKYFTKTRQLRRKAQKPRKRAKHRTDPLLVISAIPEVARRLSSIPPSYYRLRHKSSTDLSQEGIYGRLKRDEIRERLQQRGLEQGGAKDQLITRLIGHNLDQ